MASGQDENNWQRCIGKHNFQTVQSARARRVMRHFVQPDTYLYGHVSQYVSVLYNTCNYRNVSRKLVQLDT